MLGVVDDRAAWIAEHRVGWRLGPLSEQVKGHGVVQTGYELVLFGRFEPAARDDREAVVRALHEGLREAALEALGPVPPDTVVCILPFTRCVIPSAARSTVQVELTVIGSLARPDRPPSVPEMRRRIAALEARLRTMGLHRD